MKIAVIGLGYVGIPVASSFANAGNSVVGIDVDSRKVGLLNDARNPLSTVEPELDELLARAVASGTLTATESYDELGDADVILICVDTPVDPSSREPDYNALRRALEGVAKRMKRGVLVSVESTLGPGTMTRLVMPTLEGGSGLKVQEDFYLVHCPERVTPGKLLHNLVNLDRVVGGQDEMSRRHAVQLYEGICRGKFHETDWINAELCKTVENAYRDVQLAFANEVARICEQAGGDVFKVRGLVNTCPGRSMLLPGPGVGGHCIPKDSWLLTSSSSDTAKLIPAAREVNEGMLDHVVDLISRALESIGRRLENSRIVLLGGAYRENISEVTNSPGLRLYRALRVSGADVRLHDPLIQEIDGMRTWRDVEEASAGANCLVLVTYHDFYKEVDWPALGERMAHRLMVDCRGVFSEEACREWDFEFFCLGRAVTI
ncbi:MAG: nucleotide sugar dehydrogenase [Thermoplasmata archaeon]